MGSARTKASRKSIDLSKGILLALQIRLGVADSRDDLAGPRSGWRVPCQLVVYQADHLFHDGLQTHLFEKGKYP